MMWSIMSTTCFQSCGRIKSEPSLSMTEKELDCSPCLRLRRSLACSWRYPWAGSHSTLPSTSQCLHVSSVPARCHTPHHSYLLLQLPRSRATVICSFLHIKWEWRVHEAWHPSSKQLLDSRANSYDISPWPIVHIVLSHSGPGGPDLMSCYPFQLNLPQFVSQFESGIRGR